MEEPEEGARVKFAARHTFLIDPNGRIEKAYASVDPLKHSGEVLAEFGCAAEIRSREELARERVVTAASAVRAKHIFKVGRL